MKVDDTLIQVLVGQIATKSKELQVLQEVLAIAQDGYKTDQEAIDNAIQQGQDAISGQLTTLQNTIKDHEATIESLTTEKESLETEKVDLQSKVDSLTSATQDSKEKLTTVVTTISDALQQALPQQ